MDLKIDLGFPIMWNCLLAFYYFYKMIKYVAIGAGKNSWHRCNTTTVGTDVLPVVGLGYEGPMRRGYGSPSERYFGRKRLRVLHLQTTVPGIPVYLEVLLREPPLHHHRPALGIRLAPPGNHLHVIKYWTYKKIKLNQLNLKTNQYWCSSFTSRYCSRVSCISLASFLVFLSPSNNP